MSQKGTVLVGRKDIRHYTGGRSWNTIKKWIDHKNFPAVYLDGRWESDTDLIDAWRRLQIGNFKHGQQA